MFFLKYLILIIVFILLFLLEASLFSHLIIFGASFRLIFLGVFLINFLSKKKNGFGLFAGFLGGLLLGFVSPLPIAFFAALLFVLAFFMQRLSLIFHGLEPLAFFIVFLFTFLFFEAFLLFLGLPLKSIPFEFLLNLLVAFLVFGLYQIVNRRRHF